MSSAPVGGSSLPFSSRPLPSFLSQDEIKQLVSLGADMNTAVTRAEELEQAGVDQFLAGNAEKSHQFYANAARIYQLASFYRSGDRYCPTYQLRFDDLITKAAKARNGMLRDELLGPGAPAPSPSSPVAPAVAPPADKRAAAAASAAPPSDVPSRIEFPPRLRDEAAKVKTTFPLLTAELDDYSKQDGVLREEIESCIKNGNPEQARVKAQELKDIWGFARRDPRFGGRSSAAVERRYKEAAELCAADGKTPKLAASLTAASDDAKAIQAAVDDCIDKDVNNRVKWSDVAGLEDIKEKLEAAILDPIILAELFRSSEDFSRGILLYGPPGNGKTYLVKALKDLLGQMQGTEVTLFIVDGARGSSKYVGDGEKFMHALFERARQCEPSIIFIDEIETFIPKRSDNQSEATHKVQNQFLQETGGFGDPGKVIVIGATNKPRDLDSAANRRLPRRFYVGNPNAEMRQGVLSKKLAKKWREGSDEAILPEHLKLLAEEYTEGFSCSDINEMVNTSYIAGPVARLRKSIFWTVRDDKIYPSPVPVPDGFTSPYNQIDKQGREFECGPITFADLVNAAEDMAPSTSPAELAEFERYQQELHAGKQANRKRRQLRSEAADASVSEAPAVQSDETSSVASEQPNGSGDAAPVE